MNPKKNTMRYKSIRSLLAIAAVCLLATACSKEKPPIAEIRVIGSWVFPPNAGLGVFNLTGKKLVINMEHTAFMNDIFFRNWKGQDSFHDPECRKQNHNYKTFPTSAFCELYDYAHETAKILPDVRVPLCIIHSRVDQVVPFKKSLMLFEKVGSPYVELHGLTRSGHELGQDMERETVFALTADFLRRFL